MKNTRLILVTVLMLAGAVGAMGAGSTPIAYVLDTGGPSVCALDIEAGRITGTVPIGTPTDNLIWAPFRLLPTPDASRLLAFNPGQGKITFRFGIHPTSKCSVTIIDREGLRVVSQQELGWGLGGFYLSPDGGRLAVICSGYESNKPEEKLARELITMDPQTGQLLGRVSLPRAVASWAASGDGRTLALFSPRNDDKKNPHPAEMRFVDLDRAVDLGSLALDGAVEAPVTSPDGAYLYLLDPGKPSDKPEKNVNGRLVVVSWGRRSVEAILDAGSDPKGIVLDETQVLLLCNAAPVKGGAGRGHVRAIREGKQTAVAEMAKDPRFLRVSDDGSVYHVVTDTSLCRIDRASLAKQAEMPTDGGVSELGFSPDGQHGFLLYEGSSKVVLFDPQTLKTAGAVTTGRGGIKFAKVMGALAGTAASAMVAYGQAYNQASVNGVGYAPYHVFTVAPANTSLRVKPDSSCAYVLNSQTNDVTLVNCDSGAVQGMIAVGGRKYPTASGGRMHLLGDGRVLAVASNSSIALIDTASQQALPEVAVEGSITDLVPTTCGRYAIALSDKEVVIVDGATGRTASRIQGLKHPCQIVFDGADTGTSGAPQTQASTEPHESAPKK